ncbi:MAG: hypothetical protein IKH93_07770 [Bacteroidales bacterium]|nr:hypothetical protein [Bacteroidales bacterium]
MKKLIVLLSAVALIGLTSCSQEQLGPKNEGAKREVKTNFSFNIATKAHTKAAAADVQADGAFLGMNAMNLFVATDNTVTADFMEGYQYPLGTLSAANISENQSSKVYYLSLPIGVTDMVFYGRSTGNAGQFGSFTVGPDKESTSFERKQILEDPEDFTDAASEIEEILNIVFDPAIWPTEQATSLSDRAMAEIFKRVTTIRQGEFRDGSGAAVIRLLEEVRKNADQQIGPDILGLLDPNGNVTDPTWDISNVTGAISVRLALNRALGIEYSDQLINTLGDATLDEFPGNLGLPAGSAQLTWSDADGFAYASTPDAFGQGTTEDAVASVEKFTFPVGLSYFVNSPVRVTNKDVEPTDYPTTVLDWSDADWGTKWPASGINGVVAPDTRAVALQNNIQYGVALLKTTVKYADGLTVLEDNTNKISQLYEPTADVPNLQIPVNDEQFALNGILVGGQPGQVDWTWVGSNDFTNVIYDTKFDEGAKTIPTADGAAAYTTVFDNLQAGETADQPIVFVALELVNNAKDADDDPIEFYGRDNLIPAGGKFYLVGKLDLSKADLTKVAYPENTDGNGLRFPPFDGNNNKEVFRVFMQDFVTEANFTINKTALQNAYVTVPDLRNVEMLFGLSVDLTWESGLSFDIALGE